MILKVLGIPRSTYYRWVKEGIQEQLSKVEEKLIELYKTTKYRYGHRKIKELLKKKYNIELNRNTVQRFMQKHNLQCRIKPKRKWKSQGEQQIIVPNLLERNFFASKPNEKWVTDITYIRYGSITLYLATILDLYNNEVVAYKLYDHQQTPLVIDVLKARNNPERSFELKFEKYDLVIIDELGYISFDKEGAELLFTHLSLRASRASTIVTSNLSFERWEEVFHDLVLTAALTDRLTHRALYDRYGWPSYRILDTKEWLEKNQV